MLIKSRKGLRQGFTLVELIVTIAIFALIANITLVSLNKAKRESRDTKRLSDIAQLRSALHLYSIDKSSYPAGDSLALGTASHLILDDSGWQDGSAPQSPIFMYSVPRDPKMKNQTTGLACTSSSTGSCDYGYTNTGDNNYIIYFYLEGSVGNKAAGLHTAAKDTIL